MMEYAEIDLSKSKLCEDISGIDIPVTFICGLAAVKQLGFVEPKEGFVFYAVKDKEIADNVKGFADSVIISDRISVSVIPENYKYSDHIKRILLSLEEPI